MNSVIRRPTQRDGAGARMDVCTKAGDAGALARRGVALCAVLLGVAAARVCRSRMFEWKPPPLSKNVVSFPLNLVKFNFTAVV